MKQLFKRKFSAYEVIGLMALVISGVAGYSFASGLFEFSPSTTASSSEVNHNFAYLEERIAQLEQNGPPGTTCIGNGPADIMVRVGPLCVDKYEASVWTQPAGTGNRIGWAFDDYPLQFPDNGNWTVKYYAASVNGVPPSRFITWFQAQQACALSGKRLLTNAEWQMAAAGTPDTTACNISGSAVVNTGSLGNCISKHGVNDMVGNVWEWVADWMQGPDGDGDGTNGEQWDPNFYVTGSAAFGTDFMWGINEAFPFSGLPAAISRGGGYIWDPVYVFASDSGPFAIQAEFDPSDSHEERGFRCAR